MEKPPEDRQYLKDYIKEHPTNKMAWYLLGRQYAAKGEIGKANYCFAQAGEVYKAFEDGTVFGESDESGGGEAEVTEADVSAQKAASRECSSLKAAVLVLLLLIGSQLPLQSERYVPGLSATDAHTAKAVEAAVTADTGPGQGGPGGFDVVFAGAGREGSGSARRTNEIGQLLGLLQDPSKPRPQTLLLADPKWSDGRNWLLWPVPAVPVVTAERSENAAGARLTYYEAKTCQCEPADSSVPKEQYARWQSVQVQQLIVRSAVAAYEKENGKAPDGIEQLARNYPDNWISGYTPAMKTYFSQWVGGRNAGERAEGGSVPGRDGSSGGQSANGDAAGRALLMPGEALSEPLSIMVDRKTHTLALVSGSTLLRSYPVGLGGEKTPKGEFVITEKVRNPNGRDNGTFGSRGMTLSDTLYAIHGTNQPSSIGGDKSLGCIRMLKQDVEELFDLVPKGTKVVIGDGLPIPGDTYRSEIPLRVPSEADETNPHKTYKWLD
ncbi:L,D-transpeptidase [Paenibacillus hodogayensis]|uniref:L,D-transpeptidase n=1 Tax=Paenibacillus hodogayensis TaxID=279208 RepID=A0ABV5VXE8_9BACL